MKRREFITLLGGAAVAWPIAARAAGPRPRIAVLGLSSPQGEISSRAAFVDALRALGYVEGQTVDIDYRYAEGDITRLKALAQELIALKPDVVLASAPSPVVAVKSIAPDLPIVCPQISDSIVPGLVTSYARPGGSVTGVATYVEGLAGKLLELALEAVPSSARIGFLANPTGASMALFRQQVEAVAHTRGVTVLTQQARTPDDIAPALTTLAEAKRLGLLNEVVPAAGVFGVLINPNYQAADAQLREVQEAGHALGRPIQIVNAGNDQEVEAAFAAFVQRRAGALLVTADPFLTVRRELVVSLAAQYRLPAIYELREFAEAGGLMTYGVSLKEAYRQAGIYTGQILKGAKPSDLPVHQSIKFEFVINLRTARTLGFKFSDNVLSLADEVIE